MPLIEVINMHKTLGNQELFRGANLQIHRGERLAVIGPNGSGKSVLFKSLLGLSKPDAGKVIVNVKSSRLAPAFGAIIDRPAFRPDVSGIENLRELARINRVIGETEIEAAMIRVGLDPENTIQVRNFSLGMKQKLSLAQTFMENQQVLLLDEPFNGLDKKSVVRVRELLLELSKEGRTIVFTSHNEMDLGALATRRVEITESTIKELTND